jgi:hypothetical protein
MDNILTTIKKLLGIESDYDQFDMDIKININSAFMKLNQLGVGPETPFILSDGDETWDDFLDGDNDIESVKMYIYYQTRLGFDPPNTSFILDAMERRLEELSWRLNTQVETRVEVEPEE